MRPRHFEVAVDEAEEQPVTFDYRGETYHCRGAMPALPLLKGICAQGNGEAMAQISMEALDAMFEPGELDRLLATGISESTLRGIVQKVMGIYNGEEPDAGEGVPPATGADNSAPSSTPGT